MTGVGNLPHLSFENSNELVCSQETHVFGGSASVSSLQTRNKERAKQLLTALLIRPLRPFLTACYYSQEFLNGQTSTNLTINTQ